MITSQQPVVLTSSSIEASDEEAVEANVSVVDAMHTALLHTEEMSPVAVRSYYVDFYLTQSLEGGFAQYSFMAVDRSETDTLIREGMAGMGATAHLDLFNRAVAAYDALTEEEAEHYLDGGLDQAEETPDAVLRWKSSTASSRSCWSGKTSPHSMPPGCADRPISWCSTTKRWARTSSGWLP
jgi:hypothetical protein